MKDQYGFYRLVVKILLPIGRILYPTEYRGLENIPEGASIVCANHSNYVDPVLLAFAFGWKRPIHFMSKAELFKIPVLSSILKGVGCFPVDRGSADITSIRTAMAHLKNGRRIGIFPEGTRVSQDDAVQAKTGAVRLASKLGVPIIPVYISRNKLVFKKVKLYIGKPYYIDKRAKDGFETVADDLMRRISALEAGAK